MKIHKKQNKSTPGWGYWGNYGEIAMGFSSGLIERNEDYPGEPLHYHKQAITYMLVLKGSGYVEVEGEKVLVQKDELLEIAPGEKYKMIGGEDLPFQWVTISTNKEPGDKVVVE